MNTKFHYSAFFITSIIVFLLAFKLGLANGPLLINYQGNISDSLGTPLDTTFSMTFTIYDDSIGGFIEWTETQDSVNITNGVFHVILGSVMPLDDSVFVGPDRYLGIMIEGDEEMTPRVRLVSNPFSFRTTTIDGAEGGEITGDLAINGKVGIGTADPDGKLTIEENSDVENILLKLKNHSTGYTAHTTLHISDDVGITLQIGRLGSGCSGLSGYGNAGESYIYNGATGNALNILANDPDSGKINFYVGSNANTEPKMVIKNDGKVAIGTDRFTEKLNIFESLVIRSPNTSYNILLSSHANNPDMGMMYAYDNLSNGRFMSGVSEDGVGGLLTFGTNGSWNVTFGNLVGSHNMGGIAVHDSTITNYYDSQKAGICVDSIGRGIVWGDIKSFKTSNPENPETEIWYACLEGPEAAAYYRGTAKLLNGSAEIIFPHHFQSIISSQNITVQLTPQSSDSKGLAVIEKSKNRIVVKELLNGKGNYKFDFIITGIRKGFEDYQVIRPKNSMSIEAIAKYKLDK